MELEGPAVNFQYGLNEVNIPELGPRIQGKVRDMWVTDGKRIIVTTDRQSAFDHVLASVPGKGVANNESSAYWFTFFGNSFPNHFIGNPEPRTSVVEEAAETLPVELIFRNYFARSTTSTSVWANYIEGKREIYGLKFPDNLAPNQKFPWELGRSGIISTPTTKAEQGQHDAMLTDEEARDLVDKKLGTGYWERAQGMARSAFINGIFRFRQVGLILADTKYEMGVDKNGRLMFIDEMHTPDSSRLWLESSYNERMARGEDPESFDKQILRNWLKDQGYNGDGEIPVIDPEIITKMSDAYRKPYEMVAGKELSQSNDPEQIRKSVLNYLTDLQKVRG